MAISISIKDTHAAVSALQERGASKELAEGIVATVKEAELTSQPATQFDIERLRADINRALLIQTGANAAIVFGLLQFVVG